MQAVNVEPRIGTKIFIDDAIAVVIRLVASFKEHGLTRIGALWCAFESARTRLARRKFDDARELCAHRFLRAAAPA